MRIDHVQLAAPAGGEEAARTFFAGTLGLTEIEKPKALAQRGGVWFAGPDLTLHIGIDPEFRPQKKAHPGFEVADVDQLSERLIAAGHEVRWDSAIPGVRRFYTDDPFGNRLEFLSASGAAPRTADGDSLRTQWQAGDAWFADQLIGDDPLLAKALDSADEAGLPRWEVSPLQARFLQVLIRAVGARRVLEIGTLAGYSTMFLGRAVPDGGHVVSLEIDAEHADVARKNLDRAGLSDRVSVIVGPAEESLRRLINEDTPPFDLAFMDADKKSNPLYMSLVRNLVRAGALIITDNVVRGGTVMDPKQDDEDSKGVRELIANLSNDPDSLSTVIQTVGQKGHDGFAITVVSTVEERA